MTINFPDHSIQNRRLMLEQNVEKFNPVPNLFASTQATTTTKTKNTANQRPNMPKAADKAEEDIKAKHEKITKLATTEKASNGYTYAEAAEIIHEYKTLVKLLPDASNGNLTPEQQKEYKYIRAKLDEMLPKFKAACEAKRELLGKHPELIGWKYPSSIKSIDVPHYNFDTKSVDGNIHIEHNEDGVEVSTTTDNDGNLVSKSYEYQGGGTITEYYTQDGGIRGKVISSGDQMAYYDDKGKLIATIVSLGPENQKVFDSNGKEVQPKTAQALDISKKVAYIIGCKLPDPK